MTESHLDLLCDVGELSAALAGSADIEHFLLRLSEVVARHMKAEVCSIYLLDEEAGELVLKATVGLEPSSVGSIRLGEGEGLIGTSLRELRPILDNSASTNPRYRSFPQSGEEQFDAFLALPIIRGVEKIGVLAVQRRKDRPFGDSDVKALRAVASQLAGTVENSRAYISFEEEEEEERTAPAVFREQTKLIRGRCVSGGYARGRARHLTRGRHSLKIVTSRLPGNLAASDLERALAATASEIVGMQEALAKQVPEAAALVFDAHLLMLRDRRFGGAMLEAARRGSAVDAALRDTAGRFMDRFSTSPHAYLREKAADVEDIALRIAEALDPRLNPSGRAREGSICIAAALLPSDVVLLATEGAAGIVLASGGEMTHVSILARSLDLPLFIADEPSLLDVEEGADVILDEATGIVYIDPAQEVIELFEPGRRAGQAATGEELPASPGHEPADGGITLLANINLLRDAPLAVKLGAEGVGLYRTEFPFIIRSSFPSEDEQHQIYCRLLETMDGRPVTFRTLDAGGEKALAYYDHSGEENPELGLRSIRFSLLHREIFSTQIRAILRASAEGPLRIMFPMITSIDEFRTARDIVEECRRDLESETGEPLAMPGLGIMVEVPSLVAVIEEAAEEADFLSVGTNDLVQYLLAADRGNEKVSSYYCLHHPAVLRTLAVIAGAARSGRDITICGEMAHIEMFVPFLAGIGFRRLSVDPRYLARLRAITGQLSLAAAEEHAARVLEAATIEEAARILASFSLEHR